MGARIDRLAGWHIALLIALVAVVLVGLVVLGDTRRQSAAKPTQLPQKPAGVSRGYVRIPALMAEHPLYQDVVEIDREIAQLQRVGIGGFPPLWDQAAPGFIAYSLPDVPGPDSGAFDLECAMWESTRQEWRRERTERLAPDLKARLEFKERRIQRRLDEDLRKKEAETELKIARKKRDIAARYQEALINAQIDISGQAESEQDGPTLEQKLRENMRQKLETFSTRVNKQLQQYRQERTEQAQEAIQAAREQIQQEQAHRAESSVSSGSKIASRLSKQLNAPEIPEYSDRIVTWEPGPFSIYAPARELEEPDFQELYGAAASRAQEALSVRREKTIRELHRETVLAVQAAAMDMGVDVITHPDKHDRVPDLTATFRAYLRELWGK